MLSPSGKIRSGADDSAGFDAKQLAPKTKARMNNCRPGKIFTFKTQGASNKIPRKT